MTQPKQILKVIELGVSHIQMDNRNSQLALAALAQESARARVAASAPVALTDSSTGTPAVVLAAVVTPSSYVIDGALLGFPKAAFDTQIGLIEDGHEELASKVAEFIVLLAGSTYPVPTSIAAAATANDTIAAITPLVAGTTGDAAESVGGIAQIVNARNNGASICGALNWCRVAMGLAPYTDGSGGMFTKPVAGDWPTADAAATGTAATTAESAMDETTTEAALGVLVDNISSMAAALIEMRGTLAIGPFVVASQNPQTKFSNADVTV